MIERVVVAWDGSPAARGAADWAVARQAGAGALHLVRVVHDPVTPADRKAVGSAVSTAGESLDEEAMRLTRAHPDLQVSTAVLVGVPEEQLQLLCVPNTLLVLGTHEQPGARSRFRSSLALRMAARAPGPVAVVPDGAVWRTGGPLVVGVDGGANSIAAALLAAEEAERLGVPLAAVHVWWETMEWDAVIPGGPDEYTTFEGRHRRLLKESLEQVVRAHPALPIESRLVHGHTRDALLTAAEDGSALVVGKHAGSATRSLLFGTVGRHVLLETPLAIMVAPPRPHVQPVEGAGSRRRLAEV